MEDKFSRNKMYAFFIVLILVLNNVGSISADLSLCNESDSKSVTFDFTKFNYTRECPREIKSNVISNDENASSPTMENKSRTQSSEPQPPTKGKFNRTLLVGFALYVIICLISYGNMTLTRNAKMVAKFPQAPKLPLIGSLYALIGTSEQIRRNFHKYVNKYGRTAAFWSHVDPYVMIAEADSVQKLLTNPNCIEKASFYYGIFRWILPDALVACTAERWKPNRKLMTPAFKYRNMMNYLDCFNEQSRIFIEILAEKFEKGTEILNIHPILTRCLIDIIAEAGGGQKLYLQRTATSDIHADLVALALHTLRRRIGLPFMTRFPTLWNMLPFAKDEHIIHKFYDDIFQAGITQRRHLLETDQNYFDDHPAIIDCILPTQDDIEVKGEVAGFAGAFESCGTAINNTMFFLANNPKCQEKLIEEIDRVFGDDLTRDVTAADLAELKYMEMCIKEALRILPIVTTIGRFTDDDIPLDNGLVVPKGCNVLFSIYELHRDTRVFPDPEKYDPDRFQPEECAKRHAYAYIPFSIGPRNCLGLKYAMVQMKTILAHIFRTFKITTKVKYEDVTVNYLVLLETSHIPMTLTRRDYSTYYSTPMVAAGF